MKKVIVYTGEFCPYCTLVKNFLKEHNIEFTERDVQNDQSAYKELIEKTGQNGIPVLDIEGKIIIGFNETEIKKELDLNE